jgi:hypothetical protein
MRWSGLSVSPGAALVGRFRSDPPMHVVRRDPLPPAHLQHLADVDAVGRDEGEDDDEREEDTHGCEEPHGILALQGVDDVRRRSGDLHVAVDRSELEPHGDGQHERAPRGVRRRPVDACEPPEVGKEAAPVRHRVAQRTAAPNVTSGRARPSHRSGTRAPSPPTAAAAPSLLPRSVRRVPHDDLARRRGAGARRTRPARRARRCAHDACPRLPRDRRASTSSSRGTAIPQCSVSRGTAIPQCSVPGPPSAADVGRRPVRSGGGDVRPGHRGGDVDRHRCRWTGPSCDPLGRDAARSSPCAAEVSGISSAGGGLCTGVAHASTPSTRTRPTPARRPRTRPPPPARPAEVRVRTPRAYRVGCEAGKHRG